MNNAVANTRCPVCLDIDGTECVQTRLSNRDALGFICGRCGRFEISRTALVDSFENEQNLSKIERAALSYRINSQQSERQNLPIITTYFVDEVRKLSRKIPSPSEQASSIVRFVGGHYQAIGEPLSEFPPALAAVVGSVDRKGALLLVVEQLEQGVLRGISVDSQDNGFELLNVTLTLRGWEQYDSERKGKFAGKYGFVALKFGEPVLDRVLADHMKPAVAEIGYELVDLRDRSRAGVIDNLMRSEIRDSAFVLVDLTHDNSGAYWEAGYAEGLGKPVLYLCERSKFDLAKTHFDTNHCTTVLWDEQNIMRFRDDLKATIRRSLGLFDVG